MFGRYQWGIRIDPIAGLLGPEKELDVSHGKSLSWAGARAGVAIAAIALVAAACSSSPSSNSSTNTTANCATKLSATCDTVDASASIQGAGSTFDQPVFSTAFYLYNKANSKVSVSYAAVGSGTGISDIQSQTVDFGATDVPLSPPTGNGGALLEIPVALGGVAVAYNVPGVPKGLKLSGVGSPGTELEFAL